MRVKADPHAVLRLALERAIERAMNRCDKYSESEMLTDYQRHKLGEELYHSFWLALEDEGISVV